MWIEDLTKALWMLNGKSDKWNYCVEYINDNVIRTTDGMFYSVPELVAEYDKEYGR